VDFLAALDILLALSLIYLVFALVVTSLNESLAAMLSSRAKWLRRGIASLLSTNPKALDEAAADKVLDSPFVTFLGTPGRFKTFRPSYIPAWTLMQGVLSTVAGYRDDAFARVADIRALAEQIPDKSPIRSVLIDLCARAGDDLDTFREQLEAWFKAFEDQLTAWYRQKTQYVLVGLSLAVAVGMNVDTLDIIRQFSADPKVLKAIVEQAETAAKAGGIEAYTDSTRRDKAREALEQASAAVRAANTADDKAREALENANAAVKASDTPDKKETALKAAASANEKRAEAAEKKKAAIDNEADKRTALAEAQQALDQRIADKADALMAGGLKLGWQPGQFKRWLGSLDSSEGWNTLVGLLISAFALSLGAPFWFNTLKSAASIRSVGKRPQDNPGSAAKPGS